MGPSISVLQREYSGIIRGFEADSIQARLQYSGRRAWKRLNFLSQLVLILLWNRMQGYHDSVLVELFIFGTDQLVWGTLYRFRPFISDTTSTHDLTSSLSWCPITENQRDKPFKLGERQQSLK